MLIAVCRTSGLERVVNIADSAEILIAFTEGPDFIIPIPWLDMDLVSAQEKPNASDRGRHVLSSCTDSSPVSVSSGICGDFCTHPHPRMVVENNGMFAP
jgi:hypothetical protein